MLGVGNVLRRNGIQRSFPPAEINFKTGKLWIMRRSYSHPPISPPHLTHSHLVRVNVV